jgi:hypothetical protein
MLALVIAAALHASVGTGAPAKPPPKKTALKITVKPAGAVFYIDGKRRGTGAKPYLITVTPGRHLIRIVNNKDEHEEPVDVKAGEQKEWSWEFEDDRPKTPDAPTDAAPEGEKKDEATPGTSGEKTEAAPEVAPDQPAPAPATKPSKHQSKKSDGKVDPLDF